jgi:hypothetical protein
LREPVYSKKTIAERDDLFENPQMKRDRLCLSGDRARAL